MVEEWRTYKDTVYAISNFGFVRNVVTDLILSSTITRQGYHRISLWENRKSRTVAVHRLVAEMFLEQPDGANVVNHIDGNPGNNRVDNLAWTTISENIQHAYDTGLAKRGEDCVVAKLTEADVLKIVDCMLIKMSVAETAKMFGVSAAAISHIWNGKTWKHVKRPLQVTKNYKGKLVASDIPLIRAMFKEGLTDTQIAAKYSLASASIGNIRRGKNWVNY